MKNNQFFIVCFFIFYAPSMVGKIDIKSMIKGMGDTFGMPPVGYTYSYEVWNDAIVPIYVEQQGIASFMGGFFPSGKGYFGKKKLVNIFDADGTVSKAIYHDQNYYFHFYISDDSNAHANPIYKQYLTQLPLEKHDPNIYYYHAYTQRHFSKGNFIYTPEIELLGYQDPTQTDSAKKGSVTISSQLSALNFFNSTGFDIKVSLTYGARPYSFTVEKYSHNALGLPDHQEKLSSGKDAAGTISAIDAISAPPSMVPDEKEKVEAAKGEVIIQAVKAMSTGASSVEASKKLVDDNKLATKSTSDDYEKPLFSLRPNTITFSSYNPTLAKYEPFKTLKLPSDGFEGRTYTIEILQDIDQKLNVALQGLMPGNYDTASTTRVRDLTPCLCTFWYQSLRQTKYSADDGYIDLPGQVWVVYAGTDSPVYSKVLPGQVVAWDLTRPLLSQADQFVYFVYIVTTDDVVAEKFVAKIARGIIGNDVTNTYKKAIQVPFVMKKDDKQGLDLQGEVADTKLVLKEEDKVATLMGDLAVHEGIIEDLELNVIGYLLGTDVFMPKGLGFGRFYYVLSPSLTSSSNIVTLLKNCLDDAKTASLGGDIQIALKKIIQDWSVAYMKNSADVEKQVEKFLLQYGNVKLIDDSGQQLTIYGKGCLHGIVSGKISLKYPSLKLSTVSNQYVYDFGKSVPENMPKNIVQIDAVPNPIKKSSEQKQPITKRTQASSSKK